MLFTWYISDVREGRILVDQSGKSGKGWWWCQEVLGDFSVSDDVQPRHPAGNTLLAKVSLGMLAIRRGLKIM